MGINGLEFQTVPIAFTDGMDTKTNRKLVVPGKWDTLENLSLAEDGTPRLRDVWRPLVAAANGNGLATHNDQLLTINGATVSSVSTGGTDQTVTVSGMPGYVNISKTELRKSTGMADTPDCATGGGYTCYVWREKSAANVTIGIHCTLVDETTGTPMILNAALRDNSGVFGARVVFANSAFFIFYIQGTSLYCTVIAVSAPTTLGSEVALITSASLAAFNFDAVAFGANSGVLVAYGWSDGTTSIRAIEVIRTGTVPSINAGPTNVISEANITIASVDAICCAVYSNAVEAGIFVSARAGALAGLAGAVISTAFTVNVAATNISPTVGTTNSDCGLTAVQDDVRMRIFRDFRSEWGTNALNNIVAQVVSLTLGTFAGPTNVIPSSTYGAGVNARGPQGPFIHGKAFVSGSRVFLPVFVAGVYTNLGLATSNPRTQNTQNTFFVLDTGATGTNIAAGVVVAKALYGTYGLATFNGTAPTVGTPCSSPEVSSGNFATVSGELTLLVLTSTAINVSPTGLVRLTMSPNSTLPPVKAQLGGSTYLAGGSLATFDGASVAEHGFPLFPEGVAVTVTVGGGAMTAGVHQICFIYEWVDNAGQRHQSSPSPAITVTTAANDRLTCQIPTLLLSQKNATIQVVPFMTQAGGVTFNRVLLDNAAYVPLLNITSANIVTFIVADSDASIAGNELLYSQPNQAGATLANDAPGPINHLAVAHNRLWFDKADQPGGFGFSQEYINNVGLQFSDDLGGSVPPESGDSAGIAPLDEKIIIFRERRIFVVYGSGPTPSGGFNNYSDPQEIPSDVGCNAPRSIVRIPRGLVFKSQKGWYLLGRDMSVNYIGGGVATYDANDVTSAVMLEDRQECQFTSSSGVHLVYDYVSDQWSINQRLTTAYTVADSVWWPALGARVHISTTSGLNYDRDPSVAASTVDQCGSDTARNIQIRGRTSWLRMTPLEGYQRTRWLYLTMSAITTPTSTLNIAVDYDDIPSAGAAGSYNFDIDFSTITGLSVNAIDIRHKLRRMKCKSIQLTFTQSSGGGTATILGLQAMALQVGIKRGVNRLRAVQSV